jgi:hypothetical protein
MDYRELLLNFVWYVLFPVWILAGLADYLCHRRSDIEHTSGFKESVLHVLQAAEVGVPLLAALFLEINALVLCLMAVLVVAHTATAMWDVSYSTPRRYISPLEQHIHSYLEILPMVAVAIGAIVHWDAFRAPFTFELALKDNPVPPVSIALVLGTVAVLNGLPLLEEVLRTRRAQPIS